MSPIKFLWVHAGWLAGRCPWLYLAAPASFGNHCIPLSTVLATNLSYTCQNKRNPCTEAARKFPILIGKSTRGCAPFKFDCSQSVIGLIEDGVWLNLLFCCPEVYYWIPGHRVQSRPLLSLRINIKAYPCIGASVFQRELQRFLDNLKGRGRFEDKYRKLILPLQDVL
jgi:hypothetical protein